jgi:hypothetical protein
MRWEAADADPPGDAGYIDKVTLDALKVHLCDDSGWVPSRVAAGRRGRRLMLRHDVGMMYDEAMADPEVAFRRFSASPPPPVVLPLPARVWPGFGRAMHGRTGVVEWELKSLQYVKKNGTHITLEPQVLKTRGAAVLNPGGVQYVDAADLIPVEADLTPEERGERGA